MNFELLEDFLAALEHGSILAAAEARNASQPTLSRRLRELEESLGTPLLNRTPRGVTPTVFGAAFRQHAERMLRDRQLALDELRALRSGSHGHLRIGVAPTFAGYLPGAIERLRKAQPRITLEVVDGTFDTLYQSTLRGDIDAAFTMLPAGEEADGLVTRRFGEQPIVVFAAASHNTTGRRHSMAELADASWILINRPRSVLHLFREHAARHGLPAPNVVIETSSLEFLKATVAATDLLSVLPRGAIREELRAGTFRELPVEAAPSIEGVVLQRHGVSSPLIDAVFQALRLESDQRAD